MASFELGFEGAVQKIRQACRFFPGLLDAALDAQAGL